MVKWTGTGTQVNRDTSGQGHRRTGTVTQKAGRGAETQADRKRERDTDGQRERRGHR
jgi:hypothetical protein